MYQPSYPPQQQYYAPYPPPAPPKGSGFGITGMVLGIISLILSWVPGLGLLLALSALPFSGIGLARDGKKGFAIAGLSTAGFTVLFFFVMLISYASRG